MRWAVDFLSKLLEKSGQTILALLISSSSSLFVVTYKQCTLGLLAAVFSMHADVRHGRRLCVQLYANDNNNYNNNNYNNIGRPASCIKDKDLKQTLDKTDIVM